MFRRKGKGTPELVSITPKGTQYGDTNVAAAARLRGTRSVDLMDEKSSGPASSDKTSTPRMLDAAAKSKSMDDPLANEQDRQRKLTPPPSSHSAPKQRSPSGSPHHHSHNIQIIPLMEPKHPSPTHLKTPPRSPRPLSWQGQDIHIIPLMEPKRPVVTPPPPSSDDGSPIINRVKKSHSPRPVSWHPQALARRTSPKQQPPVVKIVPLMTPKMSHVTVASSTTGEAPGDSHKKSKPKETMNFQFPLGPPITSADDMPKKSEPKKNMNSPLGPAITSADDMPKKQKKAQKKATTESPIGPMVVNFDDKNPRKVRYQSIDRQGGLGPAPISFEEY